MKDIIKEVSFVSGDGTTSTIKREGLEFTYRNMSIGDNSVITGCTLGLKKEDKARIVEKISRYTLERKERQPLQMPTAGSIFKNPDGDFAGRLIENAGLKGLREGGARVSEKHANFIENEGDASARDIINLMSIVRDRVLENTGIMLKPEVKIVGDDLIGRFNGNGQYS